DVLLEDAPLVGFEEVTRGVAPPDEPAGIDVRPREPCRGLRLGHDAVIVSTTASCAAMSTWIDAVPLVTGTVCWPAPSGCGSASAPLLGRSWALTTTFVALARNGICFSPLRSIGTVTFALEAAASARATMTCAVFVPTDDDASATDIGS